MAQHDASVKRLKDFGMGYGTGAHAPDEYFVIESANKNVDSYDGAVMSYVEYFYELAR